MSIKAIIKKGLGEKGFEQLSLLKSRAIASRNRLWRALRMYNKEARSRPDIDTYGVPNAHTFFGYYDITPFSPDGERLLSMVTASADHGASAMLNIRLGYFDLHDHKTFVDVGESSTWCWQMGCRLQWFPQDPDRLIFYNTLVNGRYGAVIQDITTRAIERQFDRPIYAFDAGGNRALSVNFSRLQRLRPGYGYRNLPDDSIGHPFPQNDGIWRIDMTSGKSELIIDLSRLAQFDSLPSMTNAQHYVNHISFSPSGDRFMFFHLWEVNGQRYNRLMTSNWSGDDLCILESEGTASHYSWKSETELLATIHFDKKRTRYILYTDGSNNKTIIAPNLLNRDGHPSYAPQGGHFVTDTYPDDYREQHLLLFTEDTRLLDLARFYSPPAFRGETRCDLHPRWDPTGQLICVDDTSQGLRKLAVLRIEIP
jgi:hypothetical protein